MIWTTNDGHNPLYKVENENYGPHYWMLSMEMDCAQTADEGGWFAFQAVVAEGSNVWKEDEVEQAATCEGKDGMKVHTPQGRGIKQHYARYDRMERSHMACQNMPG